MGPNGSGKSNVSDAVRWVLGEQSVKSLRGSKMNDVIFQGQGQSSLNLAEVSLNFDNKDGSLDLAYDNVVITRRIYRDGENEYKINGKKVRLKDIRELFLDTGIGKEGYSLIGQGRIDEIISSSNYERRAIFEEASGISKHKYRRDEASKKLGKVAEDLEIIEREWDYKSRDVDKLKNEAENYKLWQEKTASLNEKAYHYYNLKSQKLISRKTDLDEKIKSLSIKIQENNKTIDEINEKLGPFSKDYEKLVENIEANKAEIARLNTNIDKSTSRIDLNNQQISFNKKDYDRLEQSLAGNSKEAVRLKEELEANQKNLDKAHRKRDELKGDISSNHKLSQEITAENDSLKQKIVTLEDEISKLNKEIYDYEINIKSNQLLDQKMKDQENMRKEKLEQANKQIDEMNGEIDKLTEEKISLYEKNETISKNIHGLENELDEIESKIKEISKLQSQNSIDLKTAINEYKFNKNLIDRNEGYYYSVSEFLNKTKDSYMDGLYIDTLANLLKVREGYEDIIDNLMGGALQNIVTRNKEDTRELINFVNQNRLGRITFLPMDSITSFSKNKPNEPEVIAMAYELLDFDPSLRDIIHHFLGSTVVVENIDTAISLSKKIKGYRIITLNLDVINSWGSMVAGSNKNNKSNSGLLNRKQRLDEGKANIRKLRSRAEKFENSYRELNNANDRLTTELLEARNLYDTAIQKLSNTNNTLQGLSFKLENLMASRDELLSDIKADKSASYDIDIEDVSNKRDSLSKKSNEYKQKLTANELNLQNKKDNLIRLENELELLGRDINIMNNTIAKTKDSISELGQNEQMETSLLSESKKAIDTANDENKKLVELVEKSMAKIENLKASLDKLEETRKKVEAENYKLLEEAKKADELKSSLKLEKVDLDYKIQAADTELSNLASEIEPFVTMDIDKLILEFNNLEIEKTTKEDLINLQKSINQIGYFTENSLRDYEEINKEFEFINKQMDDLKASKANIEQMIAALESEMKEEFKKNFDIINDKFSRIFKTLFMGGEARLKLDSSDELVAGVDIEARPPSKSLKSISLLSGGEKALTAVALLFAIFETNPAPFAILDEIDAALDETNIKRYIEYLMTLSKESQFIMITHRQTTMQLAEEIYGVTIGDDGISKIYSIDFDEN